MQPVGVGRSRGQVALGLLRRHIRDSNRIRRQASAGDALYAFRTADLRDLRAVLHSGLNGQAAAAGVNALLDAPITAPAAPGANCTASVTGAPSGMLNGVGGGFTSVGAVPATNIASWDGAAWTALARALLPIPKSARIHPTAVIEACIIGEGVEIGPFACVRGSVLGDGCKCLFFIVI